MFVCFFFLFKRQEDGGRFFLTATTETQQTKHPKAHTSMKPNVFIKPSRGTAGTSWYTSSALSAGSTLE